MVNVINNYGTYMYMYVTLAPYLTILKFMGDILGVAQHKVGYGLCIYLHVHVLYKIPHLSKWFFVDIFPKEFAGVSAVPCIEGIQRS